MVYIPSEIAMCVIAYQCMTLSSSRTIYVNYINRWYDHPIDWANISICSRLTWFYIYKYSITVFISFLFIFSSSRTMSLLIKVMFTFSMFSRICDAVTNANEDDFIHVSVFGQLEIIPYGTLKLIHTKKKTNKPKYSENCIYSAHGGRFTGVSNTPHLMSKWLHHQCSEYLQPFHLLDARLISSKYLVHYIFPWKQLHRHIEGP